MTKQQSGTFGSVVSRHRSWQQDDLCMCGPAVRDLQTDSFDNAVVSGQTWPDDDEVEVGAPDKREEKDVVRFCGIKHMQNL